MNIALQKTLVVAVATIIGTLSAIPCATHLKQDRDEPATSKFMQRKLDYSRDIVSGLATEDFEQISKAAQDMMLLSHEADWNVATTPQYLKASSDFRDTVKRLREAGHQKNLDGATLAYFEVTLNCVRCHKQLRHKEKLSPKLNNKPSKLSNEKQN